MQQRALPDFLTSWMQYTDNTESPKSYHLWAGISVLCGALERRAWMRWGHTEIYPNEYIVLVGPSGVRKGEPLMIARHFLQQINAHLVSEAITRQQLVRTLRESFDQFQYDGRPHYQCAMTGVFEELSVFLGEADTKFLAWLTNWYDSRDTFEYDTKHSGKDEIQGVCLNLLASTAPDWIPLVIPLTAIGGGFTSRIIFIVEHRKRRIITNPNAVPIDQKLASAIVHDLQVVQKVRGEYSFDDEALDMYEKWYLKEEEATQRGSPAIQDPRFSGYVSRRATHIKKLSMISSVSRSSSRIIEAYDFERARSLMESAEAGMPAVFSNVGRSQYSIETDAVLEFIKKRQHVSQSELMRLLYYDIDMRTLAIVEENLIAMKLIQKELENGITSYRWIGS